MKLIRPSAPVVHVTWHVTWHIISLTSLLWLGCASPANDGATGGTGGATTSNGSGGSGGGGSGGAQVGSGGAPASGGATGSGGASGRGGSQAPGSGGAGGALGGRGVGGRSGGGSGGIAGSPGTIGSGGRMAAGGQAGSVVATGGAGGGAATGSKPTAGCGMATSQAANQWVASNLVVGGSTRATSVRLPASYDPMRAYPVIVLLHGCGSGTNNVAMEKVTGSDAILVRGTGSASGTCWDTSANGPDVAFFDAMVADVKARFCTDESRIFVVGYSSGSWLVNQLTCIRSTVLRGGATVTGGESAMGTCKGPVSRIFVHDTDDKDNDISGSVKARDRQLTQNGCDKAVQSVPIDPSPCMTYPGCPAAYPVEWCQTSGQMHNRQDSWAPAAFWAFFKRF